MLKNKGEEMKFLLLLLRQFVFLNIILISKIFRKEIFVFIKKKYKIKYIAMVQPGSNSDILGYSPLWIAKYVTSPIIAGIIRDSQCENNGLIVAIPDTIRKLLKSRERCLSLKKDLVEIKNTLGASHIAMVGQTPSIFLKHNIQFDNGIVSGSLGTLFAIYETILNVINKHKINNLKITVIGVGNIGSKLLDLLNEKSLKNQGIDIGDITDEDKRKFLEESNIVVNLLPKGRMIKEYLKFFSKNTIIIDDTHPMMIKSNFLTYKVVASSKRISFKPKLPGYKKTTIPGCIVSTIVRSNKETNDYNEFSRIAKKIGLYVPLIHLEEFRKI